MTVIPVQCKENAAKLGLQISELIGPAALACPLYTAKQECVWHLKPIDLISQCKWVKAEGDSADISQMHLENFP